MNNNWEGTYVTATAQVRCSCGSGKRKLIVADHNKYIRGHAQANIKDNQIERVFDGCSKRGERGCVPEFSDWVFGKRDVLLDGSPVLLRSSKLYCKAGGGTISIVDDGQNPAPQLSGIGAVGAKELFIPKPEEPKPEPETKKGFIQIPNKGVGYDSYLRIGDDNWGEPEFVNALIRMAKKWYERDNENLIKFGDLSLKNGGYMKPHSSHQNGRDVDLKLFYKKVEIARMLPPDIKNYSRKKCQEFVDFLKSDFPQFVEILFGDEKIRGLITHYGTCPSEKTRKAHLHHFHIGCYEEVKKK